jgi:hypothetical protein
MLRLQTKNEGKYWALLIIATLHALSNSLQLVGIDIIIEPTGKQPRNPSNAVARELRLQLNRCFVWWMLQVVRAQSKMMDGGFRLAGSVVLEMVIPYQIATGRGSARLSLSRLWLSQRANFKNHSRDWTSAIN